MQQAVEWAVDAVTVYEAALTEFPANGWAWTGLALAYTALPGQAAHAAAADRYRQKAQEAWVRADVVLLDSATITLPAARLSPEAAAAAAADQQARGSALFGMSWGWWALFFTIIVCGVWWWWLKKARMGGGGPSGGDMELLRKRERDGATISPSPALFPPLSVLLCMPLFCSALLLSLLLLRRWWRSCCPERSSEIAD